MTGRMGLERTGVMVALLGRGMSVPAEMLILFEHVSYSFRLRFLRWIALLWDYEALGA